MAVNSWSPGMHGDNCYDTGAPPDGEGVLGVPIDQIDVCVVQEADEWLVATGAADDDYLFDVTVVVPADLRPGTAIVQARWRDRVAYSEDPQILVTDTAPLPSSEPAVASFEPTTTTTTVASTTNPTVATTSQPSAEVTPATAAQGSTPDDRFPVDQGERDSSNTTMVPIIGGGVAIVALLIASLLARRRKT